MKKAVMKGLLLTCMLGVVVSLFFATYWGMKLGNLRQQGNDTIHASLAKAFADVADANQHSFDLWLTLLILFAILAVGIGFLLKWYINRQEYMERLEWEKKRHDARL